MYIYKKDCDQNNNHNIVRFINGVLPTNRFKIRSRVSADSLFVVFAISSKRPFPFDFSFQKRKKKLLCGQKNAPGYHNVCFCESVFVSVGVCVSECTCVCLFVYDCVCMVICVCLYYCVSVCLCDSV